MNDVLLVAVLRSLAAGDADTARGLADLAGDGEAVSALLDDDDEDDLAESYTESQYATLSEAGRAGLVKRTGTDSKGRKYVRWVRVAAAKPDKAAVKATAKETASRLVRDGVRTPQQARQLADSLKQMSRSEIDAMKREFQARTGGRLKQEKVDRLVAYAQGRGSVTAAPAAVKTTPTPAPVVATKPVGVPLLSRPDAEVAAKVLDTAEGLKYGFGDNKVFVSDLYDALKAEDPSLTEGAFKAKLLELNRSGHLDLSRADLVQGMDQESVRRSEVKYLNATFHFVRLPDKPGRRPKLNRKDVVATKPSSADLEAAIVGEVEKGLSGRHADRRMVPIHEIRAELKATNPGMTDDQFNSVLLDMRRAKKVKLVSIDDRSRATAQQLKDSVYAVGETFFYVERV